MISAPSDASRSDSLAETLLYAGCITFATKFADHANPHPADVRGSGCAYHIGHRSVDRGRIAWVVAGDHLVQQCRVEHRTGAGARLIKTRGERHQAIARSCRRRSVLRRRCPSPRPAAGSSRRCRCRSPAGLRRRQLPQPTHRRSRRGCGSESHGLRRRPVRGVLRRGAHREFVEVRLAQDHDVMIKKSAGHGRVVRRQPALQDLGSTCGRSAAVGEDVLERQGHPGERPELIRRRQSWHRPAPPMPVRARHPHKGKHVSRRRPQRFDQGGLASPQRRSARQT